MLSGNSIECRPDCVNKRVDYGHWEMDTVVSGRGGSSCLLVLSERLTRQEIVLKIKDKTVDSVVDKLDFLERSYDKDFSKVFKSITCDNGVEFSNLDCIQRSSLFKGNRTQLYYSHPYSAFERGTNENINRLIRRFFPKGFNFDTVTDEAVFFVQSWINHYPRKIFGGLSSDEFRELVV